MSKKSQAEWDRIEMLDQISLAAEVLEHAAVMFRFVQKSIKGDLKYHDTKVLADLAEREADSWATTMRAFVEDKEKRGTDNEEV